MKTADIKIGASYFCSGEYRVVPRSSSIKKSQWASRGTRVFACDLYKDDIFVSTRDYTARDFSYTWERYLEKKEHERECKAKLELQQKAREHRKNFLMRRFEVAKVHFPEVLSVKADAVGDITMLIVRFKNATIDEAIEKEREFVTDDLRRLMDETCE